jgi:hypothetical protein
LTKRASSATICLANFSTNFVACQKAFTLILLGGGQETRKARPFRRAENLFGIEARPYCRGQVFCAVFNFPLFISLDRSVQERNNEKICHLNLPASEIVEFLD